MVKKMKFGIDGEFYAEGITFGQRWNGFYCPYFTYENALKILAKQEIKEDVLEMGSYFYEMSEDKKSILEITEDGISVHSARLIDNQLFFPIGFCNWVWEEIIFDENKD